MKSNYFLEMIQEPVENRVVYLFVKTLIDLFFGGGGVGKANAFLSGPDKQNSIGFFGCLVQCGTEILCVYRYSISKVD